MSHSPPPRDQHKCWFVSASMLPLLFSIMYTFLFYHVGENYHSLFNNEVVSYKWKHFLELDKLLIFFNAQYYFFALFYILHCKVYFCITL